MSTLFAICTTYEVEDGGARAFVLQRREPEGGAKPWPILVTRKGNNFYGFENVCPHEGVRLDKQLGEVMDDEGNFLKCSQHGAMFDLDSGQCFAGPCQGKALTAIELVIDDGDICLSDIDLDEEDGLDIDDPSDTVPEVHITSD
ncbi:Rieske (2Fe-2S) protein [Bradyrhizobium sp. HKCCYLS20291]|uniref:Rieske (2Fe-2S) protein n=1 Tax=Bradyrhizobium sp. HKCCYLS20291 TaxID=3420766 RepID=UPI003EC023AD